MIRSFTNVELEEEFFHSFCYFVRDVQCGNAVKSESPDFLIKETDRMIGVEVTSLRTPDGESAVESTKDAIVTASQMAATRLNVPAVDVTLFFSITGPLKKSEKKRVSESVAQVVLENLPDLDGQATLEMVPGQPSEVDLILVSRRSAKNRWHWTEAGDKLECADFLIQSAIDKKSEKISNYLQNCDECWLLVGVNSFRPSGKLRPGDQVRNHVFRSPFDRTYFLDYGHGELIKLPTN